MASATKADITFDKTGLLVQVPIAFDTVSVPVLLEAIREWEDDLENLDMPIVADAEGNLDLGTGEFTGASLVLINDWRLEFAARAGPSYVSVFVVSGNLVAINSFTNNPIIPTAFTQSQIRQSTSPAAIEVNTGSGLTAAQEQQLLDMYIYFGLQTGTPVTRTPTSVSGGSITQDITGDGETTSTVERT